MVWLMPIANNKKQFASAYLIPQRYLSPQRELGGARATGAPPN